MKDELVGFETAKLAKEKGFNWECRFLYHSELGWEEGKGVDYNWNSFDSFSAPTQSLLQRWLREVHEIDIEIELTDNSRHSYYESSIKKQDIRDYNDEDCFDQVRQVHIKGKFKTYEQALEKGLQEALKVINKALN